MKKVYNPYDKNSIANRWIKFITDREIPGTNPHREFLTILENWNADFSNYSLLDIGCGSGIYSNHRAIKRFKNYTGIDSSETLISYAQENYENDKVEFFRSSVYDLPFEDESFDFLISINVWMHLKNIRLAAKECNRVLKKNSFFAIMTVDPDQLETWLNWRGEIIEKREDFFYGKWKLKNDFGEVDYGKHYYLNLNLKELIESFEVHNLKILHTNNHTDCRIVIVGQKIGDKND
jgi:ubiquinone/menaquinone biosynthesis C-methylase UbiE